MDSSAVPTVLRVFTECDLAAICARRGSDLTMIVGQLRNLDRDESRVVQAHLATLAAGGVDLVHLVPTPAAPMIGRAVVRQVISPKVLTPLNVAGLDVFDAIFATAEEIADATGLSLQRAVVLQLATAEEAMRYRAAMWRGAGSALDARLAGQAAALRRLASSGVGQRPPAAAAASEHTDRTPPASMPALAGPRHSGSLELRQLRPGEAVALVPTFDASTGTSGLVHMEPRLADALQLAGRRTPRPAFATAPSRRASLVGRLLAKIRFRRRTGSEAGAAAASRSDRR